VSRDQEGQIHVLHNRCSHRGAAVCRAERGNSNFFRCFYHNWIYDNAGQFVGLPQSSGYGPEFDRSSLSLAAAPHVESYRGLIFASLAPVKESLLDRLADIREYIDLWIDRAPAQDIAVVPRQERYDYPANWKFQVENGVDGYHGNFVHESYAQLIERAGGATVEEIREGRNRLDTHNFAKGLSHGDSLLERTGSMLGAFDPSDQEDYTRALVETHGEERAHKINMMRNIFIFPNLYLFESHLRVLRPTAHNHTLAENYFVNLLGLPNEINNARLREHERFFGTAGFGAADDVEVFVYNQTGLKSKGKDWVDLSRGLHRERIVDGERIGHSSDEQPQRAMYRYWVQLMHETASEAIPAVPAQEGAR
jgi:benzoate/toluate 1,2-dioxygenase alpha subunit